MRHASVFVAVEDGSRGHFRLKNPSLDALSRNQRGPNVLRFHVYTYELIPAKNRTALTEPEIAEACTIVARIALARRMERLTPLRPETLRRYTRDKYLFPIGEDITNFGLDLVSGGRGVEFGAGGFRFAGPLTNH